MSISAINSSSYAASSSNASRSNGLDTTDFLQLLVSQLQNQNPLDPTDTTSFMNQITSYASYNQLVSMNSELENMVSTMNSMMASNAVGFLGHTVEAYGDTTALQDGKATWGYQLEAAASDVTITIKDADGNTVYHTSGETSAGKHSFTWDGTADDGGKLTDGTYTIEISAKDSSGASVYGSTTITGVVSGIDSTSGTTMLQIGDAEVSFEDVVKLTA